MYEMIMLTNNTSVRKSLIRKFRAEIGAVMVYLENDEIIQINLRDPDGVPMSIEETQRHMFMLNKAMEG